MSKIVSLFKQLRKPQSTGATSASAETTPTTATSTVTAATSNGNGIDEQVEEANGSVSDSSGKMDSDTIALLERRLQAYIDGKFLQLQKQMEDSFDKLRKELLGVTQ